jgi:hypothetical protein
MAEMKIKHYRLGIEWQEFAPKRVRLTRRRLNITGRADVPEGEGDIRTTYDTSFY